MAGALEGELFVGPRAEEHRGLLSIKYPMEHGIVTDWNDMERVWNYIYSKVSVQYLMVYLLLFAPFTFTMYKLSLSLSLELWLCYSQEHNTN